MKTTTNNFIKEWTPAQFQLVENTLTDYFTDTTLTDQKNKKYLIKDYNGLENAFGFAYTSSGICAGLFVTSIAAECEKGFAYRGFFINDNDEVIMVLENNEETEKFINLTEIINLPPLQRSISKCKVVGNIVYLPSIDAGKIENYNDVKTSFLNAGAKYKSNSFVFPNDAQPYIDRIMEGESVNIKKEFQFFATPSGLADRLVELAEVKRNDNVLEPSAGQGAIIKALHKKVGLFDNLISYCEIMDINKSILMRFENITKLGDDFLQLEVGYVPFFDKIIANPPFNKNQDIDHIRKMYEVCKVGGRIVSMASNSWRNGSQKKQIEFRNWLNEINAEIIDVEAGEFKESGTNIATCIIIINKIKL